MLMNLSINRSLVLSIQQLYIDMISMFIYWEGESIKNVVRFAITDRWIELDILIPSDYDSWKDEIQRRFWIVFKLCTFMLLK